MLYQHFINQSIDKQNRLIYIKNGRFIAIIIIAIISIIMISDNSYLSLYFSDDNKLIDNYKYQILYGLIVSVPFIALMLWFCTTLIPDYFKKSLYKKFWTLLSIGISGSILMSYLLHCILVLFINEINVLFFNQIGWLPFKSILYNTIFSFLQLTSWLFLVESFENIRLIKDTQKLNKEFESIIDNEEMVNFNSEFLFQSLDKIIDLTERNDNRSPQYILDFSHALRYQLYNKKTLVQISDEIEQLITVFNLKNIPQNNYHITNLGIGDQLMIPKYCLLFLQDAILKSIETMNNIFIDIVFHNDEHQILIAFDINCNDQNIDINTVVTSIQNYLKEYSLNNSIEITNTFNTINIQLCIPTKQ